MNDFSRNLRPAAVAAIAALTLLLGACGGGGESAETGSVPEPSPRTNAAQAKEADQKPKTAEKPKATRKPVETKTKQVGAKRESESRTSSPPPGETTPRPVRRNADDSGCPSQFSASQCDQVQATVRKSQSGVQNQQPSECPPGVDKQACASIGETGTAPPQPEVEAAPTCPPALTAAQCQQVAGEVSR